MKLPVYDFAKFVDSEVRDLPDEVYRLPAQDRKAKKLIEEYIPIARLALLLNAQGLEIEVETTEGGAEADGIIHIAGYRKAELNVQVTHCFSGDMALRMELFNKTEATPMSGAIHRNKSTREIEAEFGGVDTDEHYSRLAKELGARIDAKCKKEYQSGMVLLVSFSEPKLLGFLAWKKLFSLMGYEVETSRKYFSALYFFNQITNEIQKF